MSTDVERWPPFAIPFSDLIAGSAGGAAQVLVGQPLDTIKTRAQTSPSGMFRGPTDILVQTIRKEGFFALYKGEQRCGGGCEAFWLKFDRLAGMASPLIGIAAQNSLLFTAFQMSKRLVADTPKLTTGQTAAAGAIAGAVNSIMASPVELFKIRMQSQYGGTTDRKLRQVAAQLWNEHGFRRGIMRGFWVTVARETPAYAAFYAAFTKTKQGFQDRRKIDESLPVWNLMASGSVGGIALWLVSYPLGESSCRASLGLNSFLNPLPFADVLKSRVQLTSHPLGPGYIVTELKQLVKENGSKVLFRGLSPTLLRAIPAAAATFTVYELTKEKLQSHTQL